MENAHLLRLYEATKSQGDSCRKLCEWWKRLHFEGTRQGQAAFFGGIAWPFGRPCLGPYQASTGRLDQGYLHFQSLSQ